MKTSTILVGIAGLFVSGSAVAQAKIEVGSHPEVGPPIVLYENPNYPRQGAQVLIDGLMKKGSYADSLYQTQRMLAIYPDEPWLVERKALAQMLLNDDSRAFVTLSPFVGDTSEEEYLAIAAAACGRTRQVKAGQLKFCTDICNLYASIFEPGSWLPTDESSAAVEFAGWLAAGVSLDITNQYDLAAVCFSQALRLRPSDPLALSLDSRNAAWLKDFARELRDLEAAQPLAKGELLKQVNYFLPGARAQAAHHD
jgi:hypothetical protein